MPSAMALLGGILLATCAMAQTAPAAAAPSVREAMRSALEKQQAAAAKQRESIRKQAESVGVWLPPGGGVDASEAADPLALALSGRSAGRGVDRCNNGGGAEHAERWLIHVVLPLPVSVRLGEAVYTIDRAAS